MNWNWQGRRPDQVSFSAWVLAAVMIVMTVAYFVLTLINR